MFGVFSNALFPIEFYESFSVQIIVDSNDMVFYWGGFHDPHSFQGSSFDLF